MNWYIPNTDQPIPKRTDWLHSNSYRKWINLLRSDTFQIISMAILVMEFSLEILRSETQSRNCEFIKKTVIVYYQLMVWQHAVSHAIATAVHAIAFDSCVDTYVLIYFWMNPNICSFFIGSNNPNVLKNTITADDNMIIKCTNMVFLSSNWSNKIYNRKPVFLFSFFLLLLLLFFSSTF